MLPHPPGTGHGQSQQCTFIQASSNPTQLSTLRHQMCGDLQVFSSARSVDPPPPKGFLSHPETHSYAPFIALNIFPQQFQCLFFIRQSHSLPQSVLIILSSFVLSERSAFLQIPLKSLYHYHPLVSVSNALHFFIRSPRKNFFLRCPSPPPPSFPLCPFWCQCGSSSTPTMPSDTGRAALETLRSTHKLQIMFIHCGSQFI